MNLYRRKLILFKASQVPVKKDIILDFSSLHPQTTIRSKKNLSPNSRRKIFKRRSSAKSTASYMRRANEKARTHLTVKSTFNQKALNDLPPEEIEDVNVQRMRAMKQREAIRKEKDNREKQKLQRLNEEREKQNKANSNKLSKKNYTYDYQGSIMFIRKPMPESLPEDFNVLKVAKKSMKKAIIPQKAFPETVEEILSKHFVKKNSFKSSTKQIKFLK